MLNVPRHQYEDVSNGLNAASSVVLRARIMDALRGVQAASDQGDPHVFCNPLELLRLRQGKNACVPEPMEWPEWGIRMAK